MSQETYGLYNWRIIDDLRSEFGSHEAVREMARINQDLSTLITENEVLLRQHRIAAESYRVIPVTEGPEPATEFFNPRLCRKLRPVTVIECHPHTAREKDWPLASKWRGEPETGQGKAVRVRRTRYGRAR